jgi:hypothetical protein
MNKEIINYNNKREYHGYQAWYMNNVIFLRANYKNGKEIGYEENHHLIRTSYYIK